MSSVLVVGASRGLGAALVDKYTEDRKNIVIGTTRSSEPPSRTSENRALFIRDLDVAEEGAGPKLASSCKGAVRKLDTVIITAGYFGTESFDEPKWADEVRMYTTSAIGPVFLVHYLVKAGLLTQGAKVILVSSESGSITLRHESEGGGNYAHHASKSALNMVGKLLSLDLKDKGIAVGIVHVARLYENGYDQGVGFDKYWDNGGAVTPSEAATSLVDFIETFDIEKTGEYWAPRGPRDIGTAGAVLGANLPTPLKLPW